MRRTVLFTNDDANDLNIVVQALKEHETKFKDLVKKSKRVNPDSKKYISKISRIREFFNKLYIDLA